MLDPRRDILVHVIHPPGKRLGRAIALDFVRGRTRARPPQRVRRPVTAPLSLVPFLSVLAIVALLRIPPAMASGECCCVRQTVRVPWAANVEDVIDAPMVTVAGYAILVDGVQAGSVRAILEGGRPQRVDELRSLLRSKRELWRQVQPNKPFPGVCLLEIAQDVPAVVVKSVFDTAVSAGYPNVSFLVRKLDR